MHRVQERVIRLEDSVVPTTSVRMGPRAVARPAVADARQGQPEIPRGKTPSQQAIALFFRSLSVMFGAGVSIDRALRLLGSQSDEPAMETVCKQLAELVNHGHSLSQAMAKHPWVFAKMNHKLVQVGEATGNLDNILRQLSEYEERRRAITMKVKSALTYPAFLFAACCVMLIILPPYMLGGIIDLINSSGTELPLVSKIVLGVANSMRSPVFYVVLALVCAAAFLGAREVWTRPPLRLGLQRLCLDNPALGPMLRALGVSRFARAWAIQVSVGVAPMAALQLSAEASSDPCLEADIKQSVEALKEGANMAASLKACSYFPPLFVQMVQVGEEAGGLDKMVSKVCQIYEDQMENTLDMLVALLEPMVMLVMGCIVGLIVVATMLPMMQVLQSFS